MPRKKKVPIDPFTGLPEDQLEDWLADDSGRRGWRSREYWDIRHKSMTPPEVRKALIEAAGLTDEQIEDSYPEWMFKNYGFVGFFTKDTKIAFEMFERVGDFLYDDASGIWFIDVFGRHQSLMGALQKMYTAKEYTIVGYKEDADLYIEQCRGFFNSGAGGYGPPKLRMGENYKLPAELKTKFARKGFDIMRL